MKNYELLSLLSEAKAGDEIKVNICLSIQELMKGDQLDKDLYVLTLYIDDFDTDMGTISTTV